MMKRTIITCLLLLGFAGSAAAQNQTPDLTRDPGYVDVQAIESWFGEEPKIEVNIKGALLELVAEASRYEDPELANLLRKLQAVQVRGFDVASADFDAVNGRISDLARRLESQGWDTVVKVREDDQHVNMFVRVRDGVIAGMMVMVMDTSEDESYFVNIVGEISPEQIGRIGRKFDIKPLNDPVVRN